MTDHAGQWRLAEVQLANWGTFDGQIYRIPIARKGHLITGASGSGKSSLLDAIATVLTPDRWLKFNQAAQGAGPRSDQRTILSYIRGAWSKTTDDVEERVISKYLRPRATWSCIVLRFDDGLGSTVSLCRLFVAKGATTEWSDLSLLERSPVQIEELQQFAASGIETRKIQARWPDAMVTTNGSHGRFYARLRSLFGIDQENALHLLHKTQSAKNLDSLDQLFRDFMLDEPETFAVARNATEQFGELRDAHDHVVTLRQQRDHLLALHSASTSFDLANADANRARALGDKVIPYQRHEGLRLSREELAQSQTRAAELREAARVAAQAFRRADEAYHLAQLRQHQLGGADTDHVQTQIETARDAASGVASRLDQFSRQLSLAQITGAPASVAEFSELMAAIDAELATAAAPPEVSFDQHERLHSARRARETLAAEVTSLRLSGSTVPASLISVRDEIAAQLGVPSEAIPFAAELIDVLPEYSDWTGAIERVLRSFALTLLVRGDQVREVRRWVDTHRIESRLVFEEVGADPAPPRPASSNNSLVNRVTVADGPWQGWLRSQLAERFDFACIDDPDNFDLHVRAVTKSGQVKSTRTRYEKDDRIDIADRRRWVLGDTEAKLDELLVRLRAADADLEQATAIVQRVSEANRRSFERVGTLRTLREVDWSSIDVRTAADEVDRLQLVLTDLTRDDSDLRDAVAETQRAADQRDRDDAARQAADTALGIAEAAEREVKAAIAELEDAFARGDVPELSPASAEELDRRFRSVQRSVTRASLAEIGQQVAQTLQREADRASTIANSALAEIVGLQTQFVERWPAASADLTVQLEDRAAFLELLSDIQVRGLPDHETTFLRLLRDKSRDLIGDLVSEILQAPRAVEERILPVNASLRRSKFDEGRFLRIRVRVRRSETVTQFIADLRSISEGQWGTIDVDGAEQRFATLAEIMRKLASSDRIDRSWAAQCLDTRLHVTFLADEIDEQDNVRATYDSGAAMSGGQQQKLVIFCLAAALRYQLADADDPLPRYGTIVLDEAFDKADTRFTRMALDVFREFGFHLVLATPQKLLQTIEPYVGAATSIENPDRMRSIVANVPWSEVAR